MSCLNHYQENNELSFRVEALIQMNVATALPFSSITQSAQSSPYRSVTSVHYMSDRSEIIAQTSDHLMTTFIM